MFARIVSINKMVGALQNKRVGKKEFFAYTCIFAGFLIIESYLFASDIADVQIRKSIYHPEMLFWVEQIGLILSTVLMFVVASYANKSGDNKDYWYRLCSISMPITIRLIIISIVMIFILSSFDLVNYEEFRYPDVLAIVVLEIYGLYLTGRAMRSIATNRQSVQA